MDIKKTSNFGEITTSAILFFLLIIRFGELYLPRLILGNALPIWYAYYYYTGLYILIALVIWLNKNNLQSLHIDRPFIKIFILLGPICLFSMPLIYGIFPIITALFIFQAYRSENLHSKS